MYSTKTFPCGLLVSLVFLGAGLSIGQARGQTDSSTGGLDRPSRAGSVKAASDNAPDAATISAIDELANRALPKQNSASLTVGIVTHGRLAWSKAYGYADIENGIPATTQTIYRIASVTKQFTALMLLQLVQNGKVHLSDPVAKYFPEVNQVKGRFPWSPPITLLQLATHRSGLARGPENFTKYNVGPVANWENILLSALPDTKYDFEPGTRFSYSNVGYAILGAALSRAAGQPYTAYVQQHIFKPLGMTDTTFAPNEQTKKRIAKGYVFHDGQADWNTADLGLRGKGYIVPAGAVFSTVDDLARFLVFEIDGGGAGVLRPEYFKQGFQEIAIDEKLEDGYGLGYEVQRHGNAVYFGHQGGLAGYLADVFFDPSAKTGVIILRNAHEGEDPFDDKKFMWSVFDRLVGRSTSDQATIK